MKQTLSHPRTYSLMQWVIIAFVFIGIATNGRGAEKQLAEPARIREMSEMEQVGPYGVRIPLTNEVRWRHADILNEIRRAEDNALAALRDFRHLDEHPLVRDAVLTFVARIKSDRAVPLLVPILDFHPEGIPFNALDAMELSMQAPVAYALAEIGPPAVEPIIRHIAEADDVDAHYLKIAARILAQIQDCAMTDDILKEMMATKGEAVRSRLLELSRAVQTEKSRIADEPQGEEE